MDAESQSLDSITIDGGRGGGKIDRDRKVVDKGESKQDETDVMKSEQHLQQPQYAPLPPKHLRPALSNYQKTSREDVQKSRVRAK